MLLIANVDVTQQGTLSWQERTGNLQGFCMPVLAFLLFDWAVKCAVLLHLDYKSDLGAVTEVAYCKRADFLDE